MASSLTISALFSGNAGVDVLDPGRMSLGYLNSEKLSKSSISEREVSMEMTHRKLHWHASSASRSARRFRSHSRARADARSQVGAWLRRAGRGADLSMVAIER